MAGMGTGICLAHASSTTVQFDLPKTIHNLLCFPRRGYKANHPQQDPLPMAGSLGAPSLSCPSFAASGHTASCAALRAPAPVPGMRQPLAASTATSMSTPAPPSHAPCQLRTHCCLWAAAGGGCLKPALFKNRIQLRFCFEEKTVLEFLTDFYIPRTPDLLPPTRTRTQ